MSAAQIMIVEDQGIVAQDLRNTLLGLGYSVPAVVSTGPEAIARAEELHPDLILMDIVLHGDLDGVETAREIRRRADIPIVYLTAYADERTLERAKRTGPFGYIIKPFEDRDVSTTVEVALHKHQVDHQVSELLDQLRLSLDVGKMGVW